MGVILYRIPAASLLTGATPGRKSTPSTPTQTGFESTFIPGFLRDPFGTVNVGPYPTIELLTSISNPMPAWNATPAQRSASADTHLLGRRRRSPGRRASPLPLDVYLNASVHETTTGWIDPAGGFTLQSTVGHLVREPEKRRDPGSLFLQERLDQLFCLHRQRLRRPGDDRP